MEATDQLSKPGVPLKIGFSRDVPMLRNTSQTAALMVWTAVPGGQVAAISITSPDALGVRLGMLVETLPATALVRFYAQGADQVFEVSGHEIMETIARNLAAGDKSDEARTYWSPVIDGQEIMVEIDLPIGVSPVEVVFSIPRVSHLFSSALDTRALQERIGQAASCNLDAMCYTSTWGNESLATARITFTKGGVSYLCTGTLLNDNDPSTYIPYFLTANHCISTQTAASTLQTYWFYRASSCNSGSLSSNTRTLTGGATLLYASPVTDTGFMRLNRTPPAGAWYSAWTVDLPALNIPATSIHNPGGDLQKISFGTITGYLNCVSISGSDSFSCAAAASGSADHLKVVWSQGVTEGGSSGSGLWVASGNSRYLVGQLHGGSSLCSSPTAPDEYGRFDVAYKAALYPWLGATTSSSFTLIVAKSGTGSGVVESSPAGISCGTDCTESYASGTVVTLMATPAGGSTFAGWSGACSGTGACTVTMNSVISVTATFALADDGFPAGGAIPAGWVQPSGSSAPWVVTNDTAYAGSLSLKSGIIGDNQTSEISYTANFLAGNVSFATKVSSELDYDFLEFYIDGALKNSWSGEAGWSVSSFPVAAGTHTLRWRYVKDESLALGSDAAWIDSVSLPGAASATVPGAPTNVVATAGDGSATVSFTDPSSTGGVVISGYKATCGTITVSGASSPITVAPLNNGTTYACTVKATNGVGDSAPSAAVNVTPTAPITVTADCVFSWAELIYPNLFAPAAAVSQILMPYYYRYYPGTNAYLGTSSADNQLYYLGPASGNTLLDVGSLSYWRIAAGCP